MPRQCRSGRSVSRLFSVAPGHRSPLASPISIWPRPCRQRKTNPRPSLSHWRGRALCRRSRELGPVHTPEHPLIKPESHAKIFPFPSSPFLTIPKKSESENFRTKISTALVLELLLRDSHSKNLAKKPPGESRPQVLAKHTALKLGGCAAHFVRGRLLTAPRSHHGDAPKQRL